jgi:sugar phosphate isomerase/epimerase
MRFAICNEIFGGWKTEDVFAYCRNVGYEGIEIAPFTIAKLVTDISAAERAKIRTLAGQQQIAISGIHWVLAQTEGLHLTHPEASVRAQTSHYLRALVDFCADLGGGFMVVGSPKQRNLLASVSKEQGMAWAADAFRDPAKRAEDRGVTICFEPLAPTETNFINTAREAIELIDQLRSPAFKIILDVKAMSSEGRPLPQIIHESWPQFAYFHANDTNLKGPGFGETDFGPIAAALLEVGYDGWVSVEVFKFEEGAEAIASRSIQFLRENFKDTSDSRQGR